MIWANVVNFVRIDKFFPCQFSTVPRARISRFSFFCLHLFTRVPQNVVIHTDRGEGFGRETFTSVACRCDDPWVRDATCRRALTMGRKGSEGG